MAEKEFNRISINLNCYTIRFRKKRDTKNYLTIKEAFFNKDFKSIATEFIKSIDLQHYVSKLEERILYLSETLTFKSYNPKNTSTTAINQNIYSGVLKKGHNGHETYIDEFDKKKGKANTVNTVKRDQYNTIPFYFLLCCPDEDSTSLILLAQSYKQYGFKEVFEDAFIEHYKAKYSDDILVEMGTLSVASLFESYINQGSIRKLRFKKHTITPNIENAIGETGDASKNYEMEISIKAKKKGFLGVKQRISAENTSFLEVFKIDGFDYNEAYADVSVGGRKRVLNISDPSQFSASFDVTAKSNINKITNHPDFYKLDQESIAILLQEILPNID